MKLSDRAKELLIIIEKATDKDTSGQVVRYFVPTINSNVSGAGDARCLRSLEDKGLIKRMTATSYSYAITEEGELITQTLE